MRLLIVEDEEETIESLKSSFEEEGFAVDVTDNGVSGSYMARTNDYDLIILDYILPGKNGYEICNDIRECGNHVPILMLSIRAEIDHKVNLLNLGVDDYLHKPFSFKELVARVRAIIRRPREFKGDILTIDNLTLDVQKHMVFRGDKRIYLTRKEFSLLEYLMRNVGRVLSRRMIMDHVWDSEINPFTNTIEVHVLSLRRKIEDKNRARLIYAVSGRGYIMDIDRQMG